MDTTTKVHRDDPVVIIKPLYDYEKGVAVVMKVRPGAVMALEGGGTHPVDRYLLQWADGNSGWYMRHRFAPARSGA